MGPHYYFDGWGLLWGLLNFVFWAALIGLAIWAVLRLTRSGPPPRYPVGPGPQAQHRESAREILDRRFATGEIDAATYEDMRARMEGARAPQSAPPAAAPPAPDQQAANQSEPPGEDQTKQL